MSTVTPDEQRHAAIKRANEIRRARRDIKQGLRSGTVTLADILGDPPPTIVNTPLLDVVMWARSDKRLQATGLARLGERAVADRVNLLLPVGQASTRQRMWCAENATYWTRARLKNPSAA